ncbi:tRNA (adenosine(37)-N6)-threonylcarbamoyltransferase complex transferase subunit TsaD [Candidatus Woesearchaeota archaeon]|nr:MAG: tRNA (adenosine(37)-N6)-threonylcarbamoyltransferase complex transferase subunit TsaD [Candidatus Woesearchaeota archaeon]
MKNKKNKKYCLGIESTAHTFGAAVVEFTEQPDEESGGKYRGIGNARILSNVRDAFSTEEGGMIPAEVADHHVRVCKDVVKRAVEEAGIKPEDINLISYSRAPGIGHTLRIGAMAARSLAIALKPEMGLVGVNHCIAHLEIGRLLTDSTDPVLLYASGANTQIIAYEGGKYRIFGETLDIGIGNFLDQFARELGLGFPGGPKVAELAEKGRRYIELPYVVKGMDLSFGGILTYVKKIINSDDFRSGRITKEDLCFSVQETVFAMLTEVSERAMAHCGKKELLLGGGVACNTRLQEMCKIMAEERNAKAFFVPNQFNIDNAAMIAWQGVLQREQTISPEEADIDPYERTDDVKVFWRI